MFYYYWCFVLFIVGSMIFFVGVFFLFNEKLVYIEWSFIENSGLILNYSLFFDWMSLFFVSYVLLISGCVVLYSKDYMYSFFRSSDLVNYNFLFLILFFILSMLLLILSPNLVSMLFGWDGLGAVSYLLVIYNNSGSVYNSGMLVILSNRFGDILLLMSISFLVEYMSWDLGVLKGFESFTFFILFLLITAAFTKSAQIPFCSWLPAAMAAPTPCSALVHSSTLVTAGVYLLIRYSNLISEKLLMNYIVYISLGTILMAGVCANYEIHIKKIIALSTLSQLGVMMFIIGIGNQMMGYYHMLMHSMFKALMFLCAGGFMHSLSGYSDVRLMGGLSNKVYFYGVGFVSSNLSLMGFPFLAGFYSKDLVSEFMLMSKMNLVMVILFLLSIGLTSSYSLKILMKLLGFKSSGVLGTEMESSGMVLSMLFLMFGAVINGSYMGWMLMPEAKVILLPMSVKTLSLIFMIFGVWFGIKISLKGRGLVWGSKSLCCMSKLSVETSMGFLKGGKFYYYLGDKGWEENYGSSGFEKVGFSLKIIFFYENFVLFIYVMGVLLYFLFFVVY